MVKSKRELWKQKIEFELAYEKYWLDLTQHNLHLYLYASK